MNTLTIPAFSAEAAEAAQRRLDNLAKVPRSLGRIEELAVRLAGITGKECPAFPEKSVVLFAADHDIALQGVSATGQEVIFLTNQKKRYSIGITRSSQLER